jgi:uncharacterized protein YutE (UPF0331/DUF86 family)
MLDNIANLLRGIGTLLWPIVLLVALFFFRAEISGLVRRLRKARLFGQELELDEDLDKLARSAEQLEAGAPGEPLVADKATEDKAEDSADIEQLILEETTRFPKAALVLLAAEIEREVRHLAAMLEVSSHSRRTRSGPMAYSLMRNIQALMDMGVVPKGTFETLEQFRRVRNEIVHGGKPVSDDDILRAIDSGLAIFRVLKAVPRFKHVVRFSDLRIYSDPEGKQERKDISGIIIETVQPGGLITKTEILPTIVGDLHPGDLVTLEFNGDRYWGPSWYRDLESNTLNIAWDNAPEFVGRKLDFEEP